MHEHPAEGTAAVGEGEGFARHAGDALQQAVGAVSLHDIRPPVDVAAAGKGDEARAPAAVVEDLRAPGYRSTAICPSGKVSALIPDPLLPTGMTRLSKLERHVPLVAAANARPESA